MNPWQMAQQIKHELANVVWTDGAGDVVFGPRHVFVYAGAPADNQHPPGFPFALVTIDAGTPDPDDPDVIDQTFSIATAVEVSGDAMGEHAVIGGARGDLGKSAGAGAAEVAERVRAAVQKLTGFDGAAAVVSGSGTGGTQTLGQGKHVAFDEFNVSALCTSQPRYHAPQELRLSGETWSWVGSWCSSRFDFLQFRLGYKAGSLPSSVADCDGFVYTGTNTEYAAPSVAGRFYVVFADYSRRGGSAPDASSEPVLGSYLET